MGSSAAARAWDAGGGYGEYPTPPACYSKGTMVAMAVGAALLTGSCAAAGSRDSRPFYAMSEPAIAASLKEIQERDRSLSARVEAVSARFLGTPYKLGPLGEGPSGEFDRDPLTRFDKVDCTTFVEEVMALALDPDLGQAKRTLRKIRYRNGNVSYETRNHFTSADWVPNNVAAGYLVDITRDVAGAKTRIAGKEISKRAWYAGKTLDDLKGWRPSDQAERRSRLERLRALGRSMPDQRAELPYVPVADIPRMLQNIPSGVVANLVREDRPDKPVLVSHQVLLIRRGRTLYVRHARYQRAVEDRPLVEYLAIFAGSKWPLLGLNLDRITRPSQDGPNK